MKTISKTLIKLIALSIIFASCNTQTFRYYKAKAEKGDVDA